MSGVLIAVLILAALALGGGGAAYLMRQRDQLEYEARLRHVKEEGEARLMDLERQQREAIREARDENVKVRTTLESEVKERRQESKAYDQRLQQKEQALDRRTEGVDRRERVLQQQEQDL